MDRIEELLFEATMNLKAVKMAGEAITDEEHAAVIIQLAHDAARKVDAAFDLLRGETSSPD